MPLGHAALRRFLLRPAGRRLHHMAEERSIRLGPHQRQAQILSLLAVRLGRAISDNTKGLTRVTAVQTPFDLVRPKGLEPLTF
jgi:hypothetical protein